MIILIISPADHIGLLRAIAVQFRDRGLSHDELVSAGYLALHEACRKFDPGRHVHFATYAGRAIRNRIKHALWAERHLFPYAARRGVKVYSLDHPAAGGSRAVRADPEGPSPGVALDRAEASLQVHRALARIGPRHARVMRMRFGLEPGLPPQTLEQVGIRLGITKQRVLQIEGRAALQLRMILTRSRVSP